MTPPTPHNPLHVGQVLDDRYELLQEIGRGGYAVVYKARQTTTGQLVAVKALLPFQAEGSLKLVVQRARFVREMKLIGELRHPNCVRLIDFGQTEHLLYMVLEFIEGDTLEYLLAAEGPPPLEETLRFMRQVAETLSKAHAHGIIHRDLKPANIMITDGGPSHRDAVVLDFGIATVLEDAQDETFKKLTGRNQIIGTTHYMSPEQVRNEALTPASDIYAWGLVFLECLTGKRAVVGPTPIEVAVIQGGSTPVHIPDILTPPELRDLLQRATAKPLDVRFQSADEVLTALDALSLATPPTSAPRQPLGLFALVAILLAAFVGLLVFKLTQPEPDTASPPATPTCQNTRDCESGMLCRNTLCVQPTNAHCRILEGNLDTENPLVVGAITAVEQFDVPHKEQALQLAFKEINDAGGLPGGRQIVVVGCDSAGRSDQGLAVARHLVETLHVPVVFGPNYSGVFIDVTTAVTIPAQVLAISGAASSPAITHLDDHNLAWRTVPSDVLVAHGIAAHAIHLAPRRIVAFAKDDAYGNGLLQGFARDLANHPEIALDARVYPAVDPDFGPLVEEAIGDGIELVVLFGSQESPEILRRFEDAVFERKLPRPHYLLAHGRKPQTLELLRALPDIAPRLETISPTDVNDPLYTLFTLRYQAAFGTPLETSLVSTWYDAAYAVALAASSLPDGTPITGTDLANALSKLLEGPRIEVGPSDWGRARSLVAGDQSIDLEGVSGPLDFDATTGEPSGRLGLHAVALDTPPRFVPIGRYAEGRWERLPDPRIILRTLLTGAAAAHR